MALAGAGASFSVCARGMLPMSGPGFGTATRYALEECMLAFVRRAGDERKVGLQIAKEKQEPF